MNASEVMRAITRSLWSPRQFTVVYNTTAIGWEADILVLQKSGYLEEVEIKVSYVDFCADFTRKPDKHERLQRGLPKMGWNPGTGWQPDWSQVKPVPVRRFWFAVPQEIAEKVQAKLPPYAGLIVAAPDRWGRPAARRVKVAPALPNHRKATDKEIQAALRSMYHRAWDHVQDTWRRQNDHR